MVSKGNCGVKYTTKHYLDPQQWSMGLTILHGILPVPHTIVTDFDNVM